MISIADGKEIQFLGEIYTIKYTYKHFIKPRVVKSGNVLNVFLGETDKDSRSILIDYLISEASQHIKKRVSDLSKEYDFTYGTVRIRDTVTRWGSCSNEKNLNFNWRLSFAPLKILDYVVIHELCHTVHMNHAEIFWNLVEKILPDYKTSRTWLKNIGSELSIKNS
jgi:predicted metal-dependent hydrolase